MSLGPVQVLVIGTSAQPDGSVLAELDRLAEEGIVRLLDLVVVERAEEGTLDTLPAPPGLHPGLGRIVEEFLAGPAGFSPSDAGLAQAPDDVGAAPRDAQDATSEPDARAGITAEGGVPETAGRHGGAAEVGLDQGGTAEAGDARSAVDEVSAPTWSLLDAVPIGGTAVIALIEHVWAGPLRAALASAGAAPLGESWLGPADLADLQAIVDQHARL